ncbi:mitochondrial metalloendopeptidase OMA1 [Brachypodium distachyon]|uniref:Peptidase M48 domain-containing protein n=1 Tax=Brachypodium distachyon TaxID=15368 RepID=A0A0Q3FVA5_BRADI|nr:mitochondrial metalloendopeptidase OMA1 [Brachypodium distachyon]KQK02037.1 hypothetical protein BRADI_3g59984v3 [Brachypodium distachyon]|eukprot:XP_014756081.1 mitochondrial metalloendopeptidase OMA1 [Brachypodium distachyon]
MKKAKEEQGKLILPESHPDSVRVNRLTMEIVCTAHRGFADNDSNLDAATYQGEKKQRTEHLDGLEWEVILVQDESVNACCLPGGRIMVYTGFLDHFNTDAELATMLAHQVGHVIARHTLETLTNLLYIFIVMLDFPILFGDSKSKREAVESVMELRLRLPFS